MAVTGGAGAWWQAETIATDTPAGVGIGFSPPLYLRGGDVVDVSIFGPGTLRNSARATAA